jgi:hypothetical protein
VIDNLNIDQTAKVLELLDEHIAGLRSGSTSATYFTSDPGLELAATQELRNMVNVPREHCTDELSSNERDLLLDLLREYAECVANGEISGFGQPVDDELSDVNVIMDNLR